MIWSTAKFSWAESKGRPPTPDPLARSSRYLEAYAPPPDMTVSEWADARRVLQPGTSRQPGPWKTGTTPYLREIMDAYDAPEIRHIVICAGTQLGKSESIWNMLGKTIDLDPYSTLVVYPREDDAKTVSRTRLQPMIQACPTLRPKIPTRADLWQLLEQHYPGMTLYLVGANSPAALASKPCRNILRDEIDKFPDLVGEDADPLSLSEARAKSFWDIRKVVDVSSPTLETRGIHKQLQTCDEIRHYLVPCPVCQAEQRLQFDQVKWEKPPAGADGKPADLAVKIAHARESAAYICAGCGASIGAGEKQEMLARGRWAAAVPSPHKPQRVGFQISSLYSPWLTWGDLAEAFLRARAANAEGRIGALQDFVNGWLAEPWVVKAQPQTEETIRAARTTLKRGEVPEEAVALTCGVDVQQPGFWFRVRAWSKDTTSWGIDEGYLPGWEELENLLFLKTYGRHRVWRALIDTGGTREAGMEISRSEETILWVRKNGRGRGCTVFPSKGSSRQLPGLVHVGAPLDKTPSGKSLTGSAIQIVSIDTDKGKEWFFRRLEAAKAGDPQGAYIHADTGEQYFRHLLAEEKRQNRDGTWEWVRVKRENHLLDCEIMAMAAADPGLFMGLEKITERLAAAGRQQQPKQQQQTDRPGSNPYTGNPDGNPYTGG